jgi:hypothetical protein
VGVFIEKSLSTNDDSLGAVRIDSAQDGADASLVQHITGSNSKDGGTGIYTTLSAGPKADALESSVVCEKGDDHAEKM